MKNKIKQPLLADLFKKIGKKLGITVFVEKKWGVVGRISYPNGINRYFRGTTLDINTMGASTIAVDKDYSKIFMKDMGYPVIPWKKFYNNSWAEKIKSNETIDKAWMYVQQIGLPVFVKPNSKSQGVGVTLVHTKSDFFKVFKQIGRIDNIILIEKPINGRDYRIVVLDNEIISAYERIPLSIVGDGHSTIVELLLKKQNEFLKAGRDKTFLIKDARLFMNLKHLKLKLDSIIESGFVLKLLDNANLSTGGTSVDVTEKINKFFKDQAIKLTKDMGLRLCGVDFIVSGDICDKNIKKYYVIEVNSAPGLDHYASMGQKQQDIVEALYTKVFKAMAKK